MALDPNLNTSASLALDLATELIKEETLDIAKRATVFYDIADKVSLPEGSGRTVQFNRFERLPLPTAPLNEGETPPGTPLTMSAVQAVVDQWGQHTDLTDVTLLTAKHPQLKIAQERLGTAFGELIDRELQKTLQATTNVFFPNGKTTRASLAAGDNLTTDVLRQIIANLRQAGAPPYERNKYMWVVDPFVSMDIQKDGTFTQAAQYSNVAALYNAEVGEWIAGRFKESNLIPILALMANVSNAGTNVAVPTVGVAAAGGENGFAANTHVSVVVTLLDPLTGFETVISAVQDVSTASIFCAQATIQAAAASGTYGLYISLEGAVAGASATLQRYVTHVTGGADTFTFFKSGAPSGAARFVTQATGPVAPAAPSSTNANVHISYCFGKNAFGCTELGKMQTTLTKAEATDSDPLMQRRKVGWKHMFKGIIKDSTRFTRVESTSLFN